jgi:uncharacterized protein YjbI with pentapeptide repeats
VILDGSNFTEAFMHASSIQISALNGANFTNASMGSVVIMNTGFVGANFTGAIAPRAIWIDVTCPDGSIRSSPCFL